MALKPLPIVFANLADVLAHNFVGSFYFDQPAFDAIYAFCANTGNSIADRAAALRHMAHEGMGLTGRHAQDHLNDAELVASYEEEMKEI